MREAFEAYHGDAVVTFDSSPEMKEAVFQRLLKYFKEHNAFDGESICQNDGPTIDATQCLSDITDIIKFKLQWK